MKNISKYFKVLLTTAGIAMVSTLSAHASVANDTASRPGPNAPAPVSSEGGTDSTVNNPSMNQSRVKRPSVESPDAPISNPGANMEVKPANGTTTGGTPDNQAARGSVR